MARNKLLHAGLAFALLVACRSQSRSQSTEAAPVIPPPGSPFFTVSTVPSNGDSNPYGVAFVPQGFPNGGALKADDVLVANFNSNSGLQGTGSTIVRVTQSGAASVFFMGPTGMGLDTALGILKTGYVIVGSLPTTDGTCATVGQGALTIIDRNGNAVETLSDSKLLDGPWDLTVDDEGTHAMVFVSNVLSGTVTRLNLKTKENGSIFVESMTQIASGYGTACNAAAVIVGPTGLAYDEKQDILYVASTDDNEIFALAGAGHSTGDLGTGTVVYQDNSHLHGPLGLVLAPNGDLITANGDAINEDPNQLSEIVEFTPEGQFVSQYQIDPVAGSAFGLALQPSRGKLLFDAVDDNTSVLDEWRE